VAGAALAAWSARGTRTEDMPKLAVTTSAFFVAALIQVPLGPTSVHLILTGLTGAILGRSVFLAVGLGLLLQSLLFQFGGLTALGANALMMGVPALICGWGFNQFRGQSRTRQMVVGGIVGVMGTALAAMILALLLATGGEDFFGVAALALWAHLPVMIIEGIISAVTIGFLLRVKPGLLQSTDHSDDGNPS